jgi:hypothetical protein
VLVDITLSDETRSSLEKLIKQWYWFFFNCKNWFYL